MSIFRAYLAIILIAIIAYTAVTISQHGWNLIPIFFGDMAAMNWPGQFNFDFMMFLSLSALWTAWRNSFKPWALGLALLAFFGGMLFLSIYLLFLTYQTKGNIKTVLLGPTRVT